MKKVLVLLLAFCLVFSMAACGGAQEGEEATDAGDGVMDVCFASEPQTIDPALNSAVDGANMLQHSFEGLIKWVDDGEGNAVLAPGMAESWDVSEDGLEWTFHLREGSKWSDGEPVIATDFVYAWNRLANPDTVADYQYMVDMVDGYDVASAGEGELNMKAVDDNTLYVKLNAKCPYFEEICAFPACFPVRKDVVEENGDQWTFDPATYISNGPYKMTEWVHNSYIMFEKNENYYDTDKLTCEKLKFHLMDDANAQYAAFRSGELDFIEEVPQDEISSLVDSGELTIVDYVGTYFVTFQTQRAPFDNQKVREAFSLVIDRNFIVEQITGRGEIAANGFVPNGIYDAEGTAGDDFRTVGGEYYSVDAADYEANCEKARALLAEAGFPEGKGFPVVEYLYNTLDEHKAVAEALQDMWQNQLGVTVTLQNQDWAVFLQERKDGNFSIARGAWIADYNDPMTFIDMYLTGGGNNDPQYANPEFDAIVAKAKAESEPAARMKMIHEAEDMIVKDDTIVAPIYFYTQHYMLNPNVKGMYYTPLGYFFFGTATGF